MSVDKQSIFHLRELTGAGLNDCQKALEESNGDIEKAVEILRKKGAIKAAKKSIEREASEGIVDSYIHANGTVGVLVMVRCETDFVARNQEFKNLVHDIALQIAGARPLYITPENVPAEVIEKEKEIYREQLKREGKPPAMVDKIVEGKLEKYFQDVCLLKQPFIKDDSKTVEQLIQQMIAKLGEKITIGDFARFQIK